MPKQTLSTMLFNHGVENAELLDALEWKFKKIYTERDMAIRERNILQGELAREANEWRAHNMALLTKIDEITEMNKLQGVSLFEAVKERDGIRHRAVELDHALTEMLTVNDVLREEIKQLNAENDRLIGDLARAALAKEGQ